MKRDDQLREYERMGMAAMLPGMVKMLDLMQRQVDEFRALLNAASVTPRGVTNGTQRGRPRKQVEAVEGRASSGWPSDPAERSAEAKRRQAVAARNKATHPRDPNHPEHAAWHAKTTAAAQKRWKKLAVAQRKEKLAAMLAGRAHNKPTVKLAVAS